MSRSAVLINVVTVTADTSQFRGPFVSCGFVKILLTLIYSDLIFISSLMHLNKIPEDPLVGFD